MAKYRSYLMGANSRVIACGEILLERGYQILGVISVEPVVQRWADEKHLAQLSPHTDFLSVLKSEPFDLFFSIDNLWKVPREVLTLARKFAVNFHDAPLPKYAGVNATNWAIINRERTHGVTWHVMTERIDAGDVLKMATFPVGDRETVMTLNAQCYEKSIEAFAQLVDDLDADIVTPVRQNAEDRTYFSRWQRPPAACTIDWTLSAEEIDALVRGLNHGSYPNPMGLPKIHLNNQVVVVRSTELVPSCSDAAPGTITRVESKNIHVATKTHDIVLSDFCSLDGKPLAPISLSSTSGLKQGSQLQRLDQNLSQVLSRVHSALCRHEEYWVKRLVNLDPVQIPYSNGQGFPGDTSQYAEVRHATLAQVPADSVLAALAVFFRRIGGGDGVDVGFRDLQLQRALLGTESYFASHVPLRIDIDDTQTFQECFRKFWQEVEACRASGSYARDLVSREPRLREALQRGRGFHLPIVLQSVDFLPEQKPTVSADLVIIVPDGAKETAWWYDTNVLDKVAIDRIHEQFALFLSEIASKPSQPICELSIVPSQERRRMAVWNETETDYPKDLLLHQLFEEQVARTPQEIAVTHEGLQLSYLELNERANQLAHYLQSIGVGPDALVGVCMERSLEMVVALYAVLKAGGAYVPIDPEYPAERVAFMLGDAAVPVVLTQSWVQARLSLQKEKVVCLDRDWDKISRQRPDKPSDMATAHNLAYMIYTSGSTGKPKGALNTHSGICNRLLWMQDQFALTSGDRVLQKTPFSFDVSVWEFFWPLFTGARLVVAKPGGHRDAAYLVRMIKEQQITVLHFVPSMLRAFLEEPGVEDCQSIRHVICSGEAMHVDLQEEFFRLLPAQLHNLYGPTEAAVDVTYWTCERNSQRRIVPIGRPVANTQVHVLDRHMQLVPLGVPGELHIGGVQVGRGYYNRPALTAERFVPDPFADGPHARLYKTGDLCRWLEDGSVEFLGRTDFQVKIRGQRIELNEIEAHINGHPAVSSCAVMAQETKSGDKRIVAYVVPQPGRQTLFEELRSHLKQKLPEFMVPSLFVSVDKLPLSPSGKVDRRALPVPPEDSLSGPGADFAEPENETERLIAGIWQEVLGISRVGRDSNFFDLGGNSLGLIRVRSRLQRTFSREVGIIDLFRFTTVRALARHLIGHGEETTTRREGDEQIQTRKAATVRRRQLRQRIVDDLRGNADEPTT